MTDKRSLPSFEAPDLARAIETMPPEALDDLPFGCVKLDADGVVQHYNEAERALSGSGGLPRIGLDFFAAVAPCMNTPGFRGRIANDLAAGTLNAEFGWIGDFSDRNRAMTVRAASATGGGCWIFIQREGMS